MPRTFRLGEASKTMQGYFYSRTQNYIFDCQEIWNNLWWLSYDDFTTSSPLPPLVFAPPGPQVQKILQLWQATIHSFRLPQGPPGKLLKPRHIKHLLSVPSPRVWPITRQSKRAYNEGIKVLVTTKDIKKEDRRSMKSPKDIKKEGRRSMKCPTPEE